MTPETADIARGNVMDRATQDWIERSLWYCYRHGRDQKKTMSYCKEEVAKMRRVARKITVEGNRVPCMRDLTRIAMLRCQRLMGLMQ